MSREIYDLYENAVLVIDHVSFVFGHNAFKHPCADFVHCLFSCIYNHLSYVKTILYMFNIYILIYIDDLLTIFWI